MEFSWIDSRCFCYFIDFFMIILLFLYDQKEAGIIYGRVQLWRSSRFWCGFQGSVVEVFRVVVFKVLLWKFSGFCCGGFQGSVGKVFRVLLWRIS